MGSQRTAWWAAVSPCLSTHVPSASSQRGQPFMKLKGQGRRLRTRPSILPLQWSPMSSWSLQSLLY